MSTKKGKTPNWKKERNRAEIALRGRVKIHRFLERRHAAALPKTFFKKTAMAVAKALRS